MESELTEKQKDDLVYIEAVAEGQKLGDYIRNLPPVLSRVRGEHLMKIIEYNIRHESPR